MSSLEAEQAETLYAALVALRKTGCFDHFSQKLSERKRSAISRKVKKLFKKIQKQLSKCGVQKTKLV